MKKLIMTIMFLYLSLISNSAFSARTFTRDEGDTNSRADQKNADVPVIVEDQGILEDQGIIRDEQNQEEGMKYRETNNEGKIQADEQAQQLEGREETQEKRPEQQTKQDEEVKEEEPEDIVVKPKITGSGNYKTY